MATPLPSRRRQPLFVHPWRVLTVFAVLFVVALLGAVLLSNADTTSNTQGYPAAIDSVSPAPGDLIGPLDTVTADLSANLTGVLVIDRVEIPEDQLDRVIPLGQVSFRPGSAKEFTRFSAGEHTVVVFYWTQGKPRPAHPSAYSWSFRVAA
jgi:hypothetical protein